MRKKINFAVVILSLMLLLCACNKAEDTGSKPTGTQSNTSSYSDDVSSDNSSGSSDDQFSDADFNFSSDFDLTTDTSSEDEDEESSEEEEFDNALYAVVTSKYDIVSKNEPLKALTDKEMIEKCLTEGLVVKETEINIGIKKPVTIARITDSHLAYVNGADNATAREQASTRYPYFTNNDVKLQRCVNYANALGVDLVAFTGDIWDFFSVGNLEKFKSATGVLDDFIYTVGNHDDVYVVGGNLPTADERAFMHKNIANYVKGDLSFDTRQVGEITVVTMDNSRYSFNDEQVQKMKAEIAKGRPMLLMMHVPLYTETLYQKASANNEVGYIMPSVSKATGSTKEMLELINNNASLIKGIFAGHMHYDFVSDLDCGIRQYMLTVSYSGGGTVEIITVK